MPSERIQRRIDTLLDEADQALRRNDWRAVVECAAAVLALDPSNGDAKHYREAAERALAAVAPKPPSTHSKPPHGVGASASSPDGAEVSQPLGPTSFANGRYRVVRFLGEGGKKKVVLAHDTVLDRDVAFALIKTEGLDAAARTRVIREAQVMGRLGEHPNIVPIYDLGQERDPSTGANQPFMVTQMMPGGDVEGLIEKAPDHRLPLERVKEIGIAICRGLEFAHSHGIIHRDLKPGNVLLTSDGTPKIGDFGLALPLEQTRLTQAGMMVGTVAYMPPEQALGGEITQQADLYSLGCMLYEMVTGRPPFLGDDHVAIIGQHINTPPVVPTWHRSDCPKPLEALILRLLSKDPAQRQDSASDVRAALSAVDVERVPALKGGGDGTGGTERALDSLAGGVFVGRHKETGALRAALEEALSGHGKLVMLVGEPGIGKTRTALELATYAGLRRCHVLWGRCYESQGAPPYWPWVQAIRSYVRARDSQQLRAEMGSGGAEIAEIVSDVRQRFPELKLPPQLESAEQARFRLFDSIAAFFKTASSAQPIVLVLDDLHWADKPSLLLLEFIARELTAARLLFVGTYRDVELSRQHPLAETLGDLNREHLFERILLRGLTPEDVGKFIQMTAGFEPPPELVRAVHAHTEGNPLFVTEVVRLLVQEGHLSPDRAAGKSSGKTTWTVRIPEGVREVIGRRLNRLSARCNEVLTVAAIMGREFNLGQLGATVVGMTENALLEVLEEALASRVIEELPSAVGRYQFSHALIQETLANEPSITRRVRIHATIAESLEKFYGKDGAAHAAELAFHFAAAETVLGPERLIKYSALAGERALASYAHADAMAHFERALAAKAGQEDHETATLLFGLGRAQSGALERDQQSVPVATFARAFELFLRVGDIDKAVASVAFPTTSLDKVTNKSTLIRRALALEGLSPRQIAELKAEYAFHLGSEGRPHQAGLDQAIDEAVTAAQSIGNKRLELRAMLSLRPSAFREQDYDRRLIALSAEVGDPELTAIAHWRSAFANYDAGEFEKNSRPASRAIGLRHRPAGSARGWKKRTSVAPCSVKREGTLRALYRRCTAS